MRTKPQQSEQMPWPLAWSWWNPAMGAQAAYNTKLHETFLALSDEWQTFVGQRVKEDLHLLQQVGTARTPEQIWMIYTKFWQKAVEDYAHEYAAIVRAAGNCVISGVSAAEGALHAGVNAIPPLSKAA